MRYSKKEAWKALRSEYQYIIRFERGSITDDSERRKLTSIYSSILRDTTIDEIYQIREEIVGLRNMSLTHWTKYYLDQYAKAVMENNIRYIVHYWDMWNRMRWAADEKWLEPTPTLQTMIDEVGEVRPHLSKEERVTNDHIELFDRLMADIYE